MRSSMERTKRRGRKSRTNLCVLSCSVVSNSLRPRGVSPDKNTGVVCHALLHGIFPTQELNLSFLHCRWILYQLSYQGSPDQPLGYANI